MKNLMLLLFGAAIGAGATLLYLHKDIKKQMGEIRKQTENSQEVPFTMDEKKEPEKEPVVKATNERTKTEYNKVSEKVVQAVDYGAPYEIPVNTVDIESLESEILDEKDRGHGFAGIDVDEWQHNHDYAKTRLVYFRGDGIMSTEEGTIIKKPAIIVGNDWESYLGEYIENTSFVRNYRQSEDYEIFVENGLYEDEFGNIDSFRDN